MISAVPMISAVGGLRMIGCCVFVNSNFPLVIPSTVEESSEAKMRLRLDPYGKLRMTIGREHPHPNES